MMVTFINAAAWILCIVFGGLLLGDMIKTEKYFAEKGSDSGEKPERTSETCKEERENE